MRSCVRVCVCVCQTVTAYVTGWTAGVESNRDASRSWIGHDYTVVYRYAVIQPTYRMDQIKRKRGHFSFLLITIIEYIYKI